MHVDAAGWHLDYAKHRVDRRDDARCWSRSPKRAAGASASTRRSRASTSTSPRTGRCCTWRCACRADASLVVDGVDVVAEVHAVLRQDGARSPTQVRDGTWRGHTGRRIRNVVNIGIGGSDLGPAMAYDALRAYSDRDAASSGSSRTSTAPISSTRSTASTPRRRCSSSRRRRSRRSRRSPTRPRRASGCSTGSAATRPRSPGTSSRCRPTPRRSPSSGSTPRTCSSSGTGSAAATRCGRRSACR